MAPTLRRGVVENMMAGACRKAGHIASTVRMKKEVEITAQQLSPFHPVQGLRPWNNTSHV